MTTPRIKVYSELTLDQRLVHEYLPSACVAPPIKRGDLAEDAASYNVILIIDGRFHHDLAVTCVEIMDALRAGVAVFGASSMGALRAAELYSYGMRGIGRIFDYIRLGGDFRDDFLGQMFSESAGVVTALSPPFVDLHFALQNIVARAQISDDSARTIREVAADLYYMDRTNVNLRELLLSEDAAAETLAALELALKQPSQKRTDAVDALRAVQAHVSNVARGNMSLENLVQMPRRLVGPA